MSLSKLIESLQSQNYDTAISHYSSNPQPLSPSLHLELCRAYFFSQQYQKCLQLCQPYSQNTDPQIYFDCNIIMAKCQYLLTGGCNVIRNLAEHVGLSGKLYDLRHRDMLRQIQEVMDMRLNMRANGVSKAEMNRFGRQFWDLVDREERDNPLVQCMPMYIVSEYWLIQFQKFAGLVQSNNAVNPGPLTQLQILDHRYNYLLDPNPQKKYTNYLIFPGAKVKILSKSCWMMLQQMFKGLELKRFNIWLVDKPRQIMTQITLKKIQVAKINQKFVYQVQITKKETWGGVLKKLKGIWRIDGNIQDNRVLMQEVNGGLKILPQSLFLQEVDTQGKVYIFGQPMQNQKSVSQVAQAPIFRCPVCGNTKNLKYCQCKSVKYCDAKCQKDDRQRHRRKCELESNHLKQKSAVLESFNLPERSYGGKKGLVGLRNLGNTCYMNSGLQCLSNTKQITQYFMSNQFIKQINHTNPLGTKGHLACAYAELIRQMWTGSDSAISPFNLKKIIGRFAGQFSGYGQQDSQQFISYLIDGLQEDLNLVKKKQTFQSSDQVVPDQQGSRKSEQNYAKRIQSYIRNLMVGQFKSTVICQTCKKVSLTFDPFELLALPIPALKQRQVFYISMDCDRKTKRVLYTTDSLGKVGHLRQQLSYFYDVGQKYNSYFIFSIVELKKYEVLKFNIADNVLLTDIYNSMQDNVVLIAFQIVEPKKNETMFQLQYMFKGQKRCFPRYINLDKNTSPQQITRKIQNSILRYVNTKQYKQIYSNDITKFIQQPQYTNNNKIRIQLKYKIQMLTCQTEHKTLHLNSGSKQRRITLEDCLTNFTNPEILDDHNKSYCSRCKQHKRSTKQMEIYKSNKILILSFKRFSRGFKVKDHIQFPIQGLQMGPYIKSNKQKQSILYDLYGVVNHYGSMAGGHYTAYCRNFINGNWYEFDDSQVGQVRGNGVVTDSAYVLFYRRR